MTVSFIKPGLIIKDKQFALFGSRCIGQEVSVPHQPIEQSLSRRNLIHHKSCFFRTNPRLDWKSHFWNCTRVFLSAKFVNVRSLSCVDQLEQKLALFQKLFGWWNSYLDPRFVCTSLDWKSLFLILHKHLSVKFDDVLYFFFVEQLDQRLALSEATSKIFENLKICNILGIESELKNLP